MESEFYAHSREGKPREEWQKLEDHLKSVAQLAAEFSVEVALLCLKDM
jgi:hypothetical protein